MSTRAGSEVSSLYGDTKKTFTRLLADELIEEVGPYFAGRGGDIEKREIILPSISHSFAILKARQASYNTEKKAVRFIGASGEHIARVVATRSVPQRPDL